MNNAHILIDVQTGSMVAMDADGEPVAESKGRMKRLWADGDNKEWLMSLVALVYATGIERLEFIRGAAIEVVSARDFFREMIA